MSIYDLDTKGIRKTIYKFSRTTYGKTIFILAFFLPMILAVINLCILISAMFNGTLYQSYGWLLPSLLMLFVTLFILGNCFYYRELRIFVEHQDHKK